MKSVMFCDTIYLLWDDLYMSPKTHHSQLIIKSDKQLVNLLE